MTDPWIGRTLADQFRIERRLGEGGMGAVFLARQLGVERPAVIKLMHPESADRADAVVRFRREAQAVARLNHPHIVQVYMFGEVTGPHGRPTLYLAMEYVPGQTLGDLIHHRGVPLSRALTIGLQTAEALAEAHGHGIVHRDIKPANVMVIERPGGRVRVKVLDFGIARLEGAHTVTGANMTTGTPRYMSPEQIKGDPLDGRTDVYALGLVLHELICGRHPWPVENPLGQMHAHLHRPLLPLSEAPENVAAVIARCLERDLAARWPSADALAEALRGCLDGAPTARVAQVAATSATAPALPTRPGTDDPGTDWGLGTPPAPAVPPVGSGAEGAAAAPPVPTTGAPISRTRRWFAWTLAGCGGLLALCSLGLIATAPRWGGEEMQRLREERQRARQQRLEQRTGGEVVASPTHSPERREPVPSVDAGAPESVELPAVEPDSDEESRGVGEGAAPSGG